MKILDKHIIKLLCKTTALSLCVLQALFMFASFTYELGSTGNGQYDVWQALIYVFLTSPRLACELLPIAVAIGSMAGFGILCRNSELVVIYAAGVSKWRLALILCKICIVFSIVSIAVTEWIVPNTEETAQYKRSLAIHGYIKAKTAPKLWVKEGNSYININRIFAKNVIGDIYIYEEGDDFRLASIAHAQSAKYYPEQQQWILSNIKITRFSANHIPYSQTIKTQAWPIKIDPRQINIGIIEPYYLSLFELYEFIDYLQSNGQNSIRYAQVSWGKLMVPATLLAMLLLPLPWITVDARSTPMERHLFIGILISVGFHFCNKISNAIGQVYGYPPFLSVALPILLLLGGILLLLTDIPHQLRRRRLNSG